MRVTEACFILVFGFLRGHGWEIGNYSMMENYLELRGAPGLRTIKGIGGFFFCYEIPNGGLYA